MQRDGTHMAKMHLKRATTYKVPASADIFIIIEIKYSYGGRNKLNIE